MKTVESRLSVLMTGTIGTDNLKTRITQNKPTKLIITPRELKNGSTFKTQSILFAYGQSYNFSLFHALLIHTKVSM